MSNETRFTPGPWTDDGPVICGAGSSIDVDGYVVARIEEKPRHEFSCWTMNIKQGEPEANKALILASTDLYAALEEAAMSCSCSLAQRESGHLVGCYVPQAKAALAKARGEKT